MKMISPVPDSAYSKAVVAQFGTLLFVSGQEAVDENEVLVAPGDLPGKYSRFGKIYGQSWRKPAASSIKWPQ